jgi:hypothetical protein
MQKRDVVEKDEDDAKTARVVWMRETRKRSKITKKAKGDVRILNEVRRSTTGTAIVCLSTFCCLCSSRFSSRQCLLR